jgi:hypothetical protein
MSEPKPVHVGEVFGTFFKEITVFVQELEARRVLCQRALSWMSARGELEAFEKWSAEQDQPRPFIPGKNEDGSEPNTAAAPDVPAS